MALLATGFWAVSGSALAQTHADSTAATTDSLRIPHLTSAGTLRAARARADSLRLSRADSLAAARALAAAAAAVQAPVGWVGERKLGSASIEDALRQRRPVLLEELPVFGSAQGPLRAPDGGGTIRILVPGGRDERTTDETLVGSTGLGWGVPSLATALDDPRADAVDPIDLDALSFPSQRVSYRLPGETLLRPVPIGPGPEADASTLRSRAPRTTLFYGKGKGDVVATGVRIQTIAWGRRLYASYARQQADGVDPIENTLSDRYAVRADLIRLMDHRLEADALLFKRSIRDSMSGDPSDRGGAEWERSHAALTATHDGERWSDAVRFRASKDKATSRVSFGANSSIGGSRERWKFPTLSVEASTAFRPDSTWTWVFDAAAASREISYRTDSLPQFRPRRGDLRGHLGLRVGHPTGAGAGFDAAYDARETQPGFLDGRISGWSAPRAIRGRLDLESTHERPSWVDLLQPPTTLTFTSPIDFTTSFLVRAGDPSLRPRRLTGAVGAASLVTGALRVELTGSLRRVTDDFGWDLSADSSLGGYTLRSEARLRGDGWLSCASGGWEFRKGPLHTRGVAWVRGGPDSLSPRAGAPPRVALEATADVRFVLFQGDLPIRLGVESHARGPRRGLVDEAGQVLWDGTAGADLGPAGVFLRIRNAFDHRVGSALLDPYASEWSPLPGRAFSFGVVWNLVD